MPGCRKTSCSAIRTRKPFPSVHQRTESQEAQAACGLWGRLPGCEKLLTRQWPAKRGRRRTASPEPEERLSRECIRHSWRIAPVPVWRATGTFRVSAALQPLLNPACRLSHSAGLWRMKSFRSFAAAATAAALKHTCRLGRSDFVPFASTQSPGRGPFPGRC